MAGKSVTSGRPRKVDEKLPTPISRLVVATPTGETLSYDGLGIMQLVETYYVREKMSKGKKVEEKVPVRYITVNIKVEESHQ